MVSRSIITSLLVFSFAAKVLGQTVLITIGDQQIATEDFLFVYNKNKYYQDTLPTAQSIEQYLELFINFKLKVLEAYQLGLDE